MLALDVGGTKLAAGLVRPDGRVLHPRRVPTPQGAPASVLWDTVEGLLAAVVAAGGNPLLAGVGIGCGGPMDWPAGNVSPLNIPGWRGFPLRDRVASAYQGLPVRLHNDAICFTVAEHWRGAGQGHRNVLGVVVSTGVGGGLVLGGRVLDGGTGNAGHIGHVVVEPAGPPCACGGRGCLEAVARGPAVVGWAREHGWSAPPGAAGAELAAAARTGERVAVAAFARAGRALGVALASSAALLDLDVVAVGGGVAQAGDLLLGPLATAYRQHAQMDFVRRLSVVPAMLGQHAGLVGAAALVHAGDTYWPAREDDRGTAGGHRQESGSGRRGGVGTDG